MLATDSPLLHERYKAHRESTPTDLRDQLSYEKQRRLALEANFEREKQERLEQAERGRVDVEGAIANVQNRAEDADQAAQAAVAALLAKKERKKKRAKSRQQSRM